MAASLFTAAAMLGCSPSEVGTSEAEDAITIAGPSIGGAPLTISDDTEERVGEQLRPRIARAFELIERTEAGRALATRLGNQPISLSLTDAYGVGIRVQTGTRSIEANPTLLDSLPDETLAAVFAHELEHVSQNMLAYRRELDAIVEFAALSVEYQVWSDLPRIDDRSPEASRLVAYRHFPSATLQLWRASRYSWSEEPLEPVASWTDAARAYWQSTRASEAAVRARTPASEPTEAEWASIDVFTADRLRGDHFFENGIDTSDGIGRAFFAELDRLGEAEIGASFEPSVNGAAERFTLEHSYAGTYVEPTFHVTNPIRRTP